MAGAGGVSPVPVGVVPVNSAPPTLAAGQQFQVTVSGTPGNLFIVTGGARIPIHPNVAVELGQLVNVEVVASERGMQLRLTPQPEPSVQTPTAGSGAAGQPSAPGHAPQTAPVSVSHQGVSQAPAAPGGATPPAAPAATIDLSSAATASVQGESGSQPSLGEVVSAALRSLGLLETTAAQTRLPEMLANASQLLPDATPASPLPVRQLLALFLTRNASGEDLQTIQTMLSNAADAGALPQGLADTFSNVISRLLIDDPAKLLETLQQWARSGAPIEARMALALASGNVDELFEQLGQDLRGLLDRVNESEPLLRFLRNAGQLRGFRDAMGRVLDRLAGQDVQNLRGLQTSYQFMELPISPESPFQRVQVHVLGDQGGKKREFDAQNASVLIDVSSTRLGDLWVTLSVAAGRCACAFRATEQPTVDAIEADASELREALDAVGYPGSQVTAHLWNGDRLSELAALAQRFQGTDLQA
ncbi:MAG: flagellar hook-length control protein FliK [bacterium]|nr:flagellar hook-length control protein FliK [bacterium]